MIAPNSSSCPPGVPLFLMAHSADGGRAIEMKYQIDMLPMLRR